ncbi:MAG TPA: ABC transporter ATP-binding protein, partial [Pyrinomonadaceae bacterium]
MRGELKRLQHELGTTTVYVTHDQAGAMTLAHRVAVMREGRLQQFDMPLDIYHRPANRFVAEFVGSPGMNFIEGRLDEAARTFVSEAFKLSASQLKRVKGRGAVTLGIRPEHVHLAILEQDGSLPAKVHVTELMGNETLVFLRFPDGAQLIARAPASFRAELESNIRVIFEAERVDFFDAESGE